MEYVCYTWLFVFGRILPQVIESATIKRISSFASTALQKTCRSKLKQFSQKSICNLIKYANMRKRLFLCLRIVYFIYACRYCFYYMLFLYLQCVVIGYGLPENIFLSLTGRITCIITTFFYFNEVAVMNKQKILRTSNHSTHFFIDKLFRPNFIIDNYKAVFLREIVTNKSFRDLNLL